MAERASLIKAREARGLTRIQLAEAMGASRNHVYVVEMGQRNPSLDLMRRWLKALGKGSLALFDDHPSADAAEKAA